MNLPIPNASTSTSRSGSVSDDTVAQRPQEPFVNAQPAQVDSLDGFEEILGESDVPF
jgi:hypothetical protein